MPATLRITRTNGFGRGKTESFDQGSLLLGTDATSQLRFDPAWDRTVSVRHARLVWDSGTWWVEDTSAQGTFLAGRNLTGRERLAPGAVLELGKTGPIIRLDWDPLPEPQAMPVQLVRSFAAATVPAPAAPRPVGNPKKWWLIGGLAAAALVLAGLFVLVRRTSSPDAAFAAIAEDKAEAVALVTIVAEGYAPGGIATAWAIGDHVYATNSHVTEDVQKVLAKGGACFLVINRHPDSKLHVTRAVVHPRYGKDEVSFDGKPMAVPGYDVGLLYTEEKAPKKLRIAPKSELEKVDSGYRIAYLGFPMENMAGGGVNVRNPVATMQSGIVTSATDYWLGKASFASRLLIQHNLASAGGASGSPILNTSGEVVGIHSAGNFVGSIGVSEEGKAVVQRAPSGALVNFAQRIDLLADIWPEYPGR